VTASVMIGVMLTLHASTELGREKHDTTEQSQSQCNTKALLSTEKYSTNSEVMLEFIPECKVRCTN